MAILVLGASHQHVSPIDLAGLALDAAGQVDLDTRLRQEAGISGHLILSTCNRTEVYVSSSAPVSGATTVIREWAAVRGRCPDWLRSTVRLRLDEEATRHAFSVATGLDSRAPGEPQIQGQFRRAYRRARDAGTVDSSLAGFCDATLHVSRRVRRATGLGELAPSVIDIGLDRARTLLSVSEPRFALLGAGQMAAVSAKALQRRGVAGGLVYARDRRAAAAIAAQIGPGWGATSVVGEAVRDAEVIISAVACATPIVTVSLLENGSGAKERVFLDLGMPPTVAADVGALPGTHYLPLHQLHQTPDRAHQEALDAASELVRGHVAVHHEAEEPAVVRAMTVMRRHAADAIAQELARASGSTAPITHGDLEKALRRLSGRLLHAPTLGMREAMRQARSPHDLADALCRVYTE